MANAPTSAGNKVLGFDQKLSDDHRKFFKEIYDKHHHALCAFLYKLGLPQDRHADISQDVYLRLVRQNEPDKLNIAPRMYLYKIATNLYRDMLRRGKRLPGELLVYDDEKVSTILTSPEIRIHAEQQMQRLKTAVRALPVEKQKILFMAKFHNHTCKEIANELDMSLRSVQRKLSDALLFCQSQLKEDEDD